ncbi:dipicolinic acid synthetase subunit A [Halobacillus amylolyticus]|uniref:Dipicolinic acid synthetase subunit A n=1 Tax=Halobacillus amylolyticus TaxID=2932259 RepID=A0ABY4HCY6_9BACI|nr:dipicolinic acid synthetase subunit A [Halobacillus amylolyticus]UOR12681.1 dipicolinic acid synthetase subunit A [Halobacillus amylolyticus]
MLTGYHVAVIGGDARQIEIIRRLNEWGVQVYLAGFDQLNGSFTEATELEFDSDQVERLDAVILPVSGTDENGCVDGVFTNRSIPLKEEWLSRTPENCMVFTGITNEALTQIVHKSKRSLIPLMNRDDVAIYNSIPTVEGTIMMAIQHTDFTIHGSHVLLLGLGRVGMSLARSFDQLGAEVTVAVHSSKDAARAYEMGMTPLDIETLPLHDLTFDLVLNTVPASVVDASIIKKLPTHALILDIASKPGGTDFRYAEKRGIKSILVPGLPGIVAPKTAGRIIANVISQQLLRSNRKVDD